MWPDPQETVTLVTFTEEILNGRFNVFCRAHIFMFYRFHTFGMRVNMCIHAFNIISLTSGISFDDATFHLFTSNQQVRKKLYLIFPKRILLAQGRTIMKPYFVSALQSSSRISLNLIYVYGRVDSLL